MPTYRVTVSIKLHTPCDADVLAEHVAEAVSRWGGQYHPDDELFPTNFIQVKATCRGEVSIKD